MHSTEMPSEAINHTALQLFWTIQTTANTVLISLNAERNKHIQKNALCTFTSW